MLQRFAGIANHGGTGKLGASQSRMTRSTPGRLALNKAPGTGHRGATPACRQPLEPSRSNRDQDMNQQSLHVPLLPGSAAGLDGANLRRVAALAVLVLAAQPTFALPGSGRARTPGVGSTHASRDIRPPSMYESLDPSLRTLLLGLPSCTVLRLNAAGLPDVLMDFYFGTSGPTSTRDLLEQAESFQFDEESSETHESPKTVPGESRLDFPDWRTVILPDVRMPEGEPMAMYVDSVQSLIVAFRPARANLSCSVSRSYVYNGYHHTGPGAYWYVQCDGVVAAAQARRDRNSNPNLRLFKWDGANWVLDSSSSQGSYMDYVRDYSSSCSSKWYLVDVTMANEGYYTLVVFAFKASS